MTIRKQASKWFVKLRSGAITPGSDKKFQSWLRDNPEHKLSYQRCEQSAVLIKGLESDPELRPLIDQCARLKKQYKAKISGSTPGLFEWLFNHRLSVAATALVLGGVIAVFITSIMPVRYKTAIGEQRMIVLEDRSTVTLNTNTEIAVHYSSRSRRIELKQGEAFFDVSHDPSRQFEVMAGNGVVQAIGTAFDVALEGDKVTVTVLEGKVSVTQKNERPEEFDHSFAPKKLNVGESLHYWNTGVVAEVNVADKKRIVAWREGKLNFDGLRLADAIKEHNRYTLHKIVLGSDDVRNLSISGVFRIGDTESLLYLLEQSLGLQAIKRDNLILLVKPSKSRLADPAPESVESTHSG